MENDLRPQDFEKLTRPRGSIILGSLNVVFCGMCVNDYGNTYLMRTGWTLMTYDSVHISLLGDLGRMTLRRRRPGVR